MNSLRNPWLGGCTLFSNTFMSFLSCLCSVYHCSIIFYILNLAFRFLLQEQNSATTPARLFFSADNSEHREYSGTLNFNSARTATVTVQVFFDVSAILCHNWVVKLSHYEQLVVCFNLYNKCDSHVRVIKGYTIKPSKIFFN